jgi:hypothetical protein
MQVIWITVESLQQKLTRIFLMADLKDALKTKLRATGQLRPLYFGVDKMTPNKVYLLKPGNFGK